MQIRNLVYAGVFTWVIVALPHLREITIPWAICYVAFLALFLFATRKECTGPFELALIGV